MNNRKSINDANIALIYLDGFLEKMGGTITGIENLRLDENNNANVKIEIQFKPEQLWDYTSKTRLHRKLIQGEDI